MSNLYKKLLQIQKEVEKFSKDTKGHGFSYTSGDQVLGKIRPLMNANGLLLKQEVISTENTRYDYTTSAGKDKSEILTGASMRFTWIDTETGEKDESLFYASGMNGWEQGLGSALTYGERYFLLKFFHVPTDGDDVDNPSRKGASERQNGTPTEDNRQWLNVGTKDWTNAVSKRVPLKEVMTFYKVNKANQEQYLKEISK